MPDNHVGTHKPRYPLSRKALALWLAMWSLGAAGLQGSMGCAGTGDVTYVDGAAKSEPGASATTGLATHLTTLAAQAEQMSVQAPVQAPVEVETLELEVHTRYPHDPEAFTQGLVWDAGRLFESTGLRGRSSLREVELSTGRVLRSIDNDPAIFAEGLALVDDQLVQLSWQEQVALVWKADDFTPVTEFDYEGEGWGLCYDGEALVMSDGSDQLYFRNPTTFAALRTVQVTLRGQPLPMLNELECVKGKVFANIWQTDTIVRIDPTTGVVDGSLQAADLLTAEERAQTDVLNGIAYLPESERFLITGKLWPWMFEVSFNPPCAPGEGAEVDAGN